MNDISNIMHFDKALVLDSGSPHYVEFNNDISIKLELYLTSEKITSNIPAKYKIFLTNIF